MFAFSVLGVIPKRFFAPKRLSGRGASLHVRAVRYGRRSQENFHTQVGVRWRGGVPPFMSVLSVGIDPKRSFDPERLFGEGGSPLCSRRQSLGVVPKQFLILKWLLVGW